MDFLLELTENRWIQVAGALFMALLAIWLTVARADSERSREFGIRIAEAFKPELDLLLQNKAAGANKVLTEEALRKHASAINANIAHLSAVRLLRVRWAWYKLAYERKCHRIYGPSYSHYFDAGSLHDRPYLVRFAIERIQKLILSAAK